MPAACFSRRPQRLCREEGTPVTRPQAEPAPAAAAAKLPTGAGGPKTLTPPRSRSSGCSLRCPASLSHGDLRPRGSPLISSRSGEVNPPSPRFCLRQNARTPQKRRGPEGPLGKISRWQIENLKYLDCSALPQKRASALQMPFFQSVKEPRRWRGSSVII